MEYKPRSQEVVSRNMAAIRSRDNKTEVALRRALHRLGLRYRVQYSRLPGTPDIVFVRQRLAVFVDGDFWHARFLREERAEYITQRVKKNTEFWKQKLERNMERDVETDEALRQMGWTVVRLWESDVRADQMAAISQIVQALRAE